MPEAIAAAWSGFMGAPGNSAMIVTASLPAVSLPAAVPPSLRKSLSLISASLPIPTTTRRLALSPSGARRSSAVPLFPLNRFVSAARLTKLTADPSVLRVAGPNSSFSSQKTTRIPRGVAENGTKPTLTASVMGKSSENQGCRWAGSRRAVAIVASGHYGPSAAVLPSVSRGRGATSPDLLTISQARHGPAILLTDQRDGSGRISQPDPGGATIGDPARDWS